MKVGVRKPSIKKSIKARTTGRVKRTVKSSLIPGYGKKGMGYIKNPKKALYNKVYHKTTVGVCDVARVVLSDKTSNETYKAEHEGQYSDVQPKEINPGTYKVGGYFVISISVVLIILSAILALVYPFIGAVAVIFGVLLILYGRKMIKVAKDCKDISE